MVTDKTVKESNDPYMAAWERAKARMETMSKDEKRQVFVKAGILTQKGEVTSPFKKVFVKTKQAS